MKGPEGGGAGSSSVGERRAGYSNARSITRAIDAQLVPEHEEHQRARERAARVAELRVGSEHGGDIAEQR
jgi:hypothetical protein